MSWRSRLEFTGFCMAGLGFLIVIMQLGGFWRFGAFDTWVMEATFYGSLEQWAVLAYLCVTAILLCAKE